MAFRLAGAIWRFWGDYNQSVEGSQWLKAVLDLNGTVPDPIRAKALHGAGTLTNGQSDQALAISYLEQAAEIYRRLTSSGGYRLELGAVLNNLAVIIHWERGDLELAELLYQEALSLFREGTQWGVAVTLGNLGSLALHKGDVVMAAELFDENLRIARELGPLRLGSAYDLFSDLHLETGDIAKAIEDLESSMEHFVAAGDHSSGTFARARLGHAHHENGNIDRALELFVPNATALLADPEFETRVGHILELAIARTALELAVQEPERAAVLIGAIDRLVNEGAYLAGSSKRLRRYRRQMEGLLDPDTVDKAASLGAAMTLQEVRSLITDTHLAKPVTVQGDIEVADESREP